MATDFDIADLLEKLKDLYGDKFNTKQATIAAWLDALKFAEPINLNKAVQHWIETSPKIPTLFDMILTVRKFQPLRKFSENEHISQSYKSLEQANLRNGLRKVRVSDSSITWKRKEHLCIYKGQHTDKIEAILDYFGEKDWLIVLRTELDIKPEDGLRGINKIISNKHWVGRYRELVEQHLAMIPEVQTA